MSQEEETAPVKTIEEEEPVDDDDLTRAQYFLTIVVTAMAAILLVIATHKLERNRGKNLIYHGIYWGCAIVFILIMPTSIQEAVFSDLGVVVVGTVFPTYESIRAVCTATTEDDKSWLQYWVAQAALYFIAAWADDYGFLLNHAEMYHIRQFECVYFLWLLLPFTDGAALTFEYITEPFVTPIIRPMTNNTTSFVNALTSTTINVVHIAIAWFCFAILPRFAKRIIILMIGVTYPVLASIVAVSSETGEDDTFWLTYWSSFGLLFLIMDFLENYLSRFPGFYSLMLIATLYLMLPMARGAEKVFRNILVPLAGLQEELLTGDALRVKREILKQLPPNTAAKLREKIANSFANDDSDLPPYLQTKAKEAKGYGATESDTLIV